MHKSNQQIKMNLSKKINQILEEIAEMLAPAAITLRRPSGEVDLILHKKEPVCSRLEHRCRSPAHAAGRVCRSANTSPNSSNLPSPDDIGSSTSLQYDRYASPSSSPGHSPCRVTSSQLREDADKINRRMKSKSGGLRGSVESIKSMLSAKKELCPSKRTLRVEKITSARKSKRGSKDDMCIVSYDQTDHNLTTSLLMTNLEEGYFSAELSLTNLPYGNMTVRIRDYKLEIMIDKESHRDHCGGGGGKAPKCLCYCGSLAIPIYVMPHTLDMTLNEGKNVLEMRGMTKGYQYQRMTSSAADLRPRSGRTSPIHNRLAAGLVRLFSHSRDSSESRECLEVETSAMRDRANTR